MGGAQGRDAGVPRSAWFCRRFDGRRRHDHRRRREPAGTRLALLDRPWRRPAVRAQGGQATFHPRANGLVAARPRRDADRRRPGRKPNGLPPPARSDRATRRDGEGAAHLAAVCSGDGGDARARSLEGLAHEPSAGILLRPSFVRSIHARIARPRPFAPGGVTDTFGRLMAQKLTEQLGKQVYVENIAGASGNIGTGQVAKAVPDGYTILFAFSSHVVNPTLFARVPYDPIKDFDPVTLAVASTTVITVNPSVPAKTVKELVDLIKANPGKYSFGSAGAGTQAHLAGEQFRLSLGLDPVHVPFGGGGPAVAAVVAGHTPISFGSPQAAMQHVKEGTVRALAVTSKARSQLFPDVPTMTEAGYPEIEGDSWVGILVPAGTPADTVGA